MKQTIRWIVPLLLLISGSGVCFAQSTNAGDIRGSVTDSSGALIPDVTVTVVNVDTGVSKDFVTNHDGLFDTSSIVAGSYKLTFKKEGFEELVRGPVSVEVGLTTVNGSLKIGSTTVQVTVSTDVPLLHTETGDQTVTLEAHDMDQMPNFGAAGGNGPDWQNFMILLPGASGTSGGAQGSTNPGMASSTNGNLPFTDILADGASTTLPSSQNANPAAFEDVEELQVSLSTFSAQYGVGGMVINQITKGGTSKFHGSLYDYSQQDAWDAASYGFGSVVKVPYLRYDDFGGTVGGPVDLPGLKKKAFFFFGYDQIIDNTVSSGFQTVPTTAIMSGNFTGSYLLYDPTTQTIGTDSAGHSYPIRKSFLEEYGTNAIPASMIDSVSNNFQQYYPTPTNHIPYGQFATGALQPTGVLTNNFYSEYPNPRPWKRYFGRLDYDITPNNRLTMSDTQGDEIENGDNAVAACPIGCQLGDVDNNNAQITDVWNISGKTINEARMGYTDQLNFFSDSGTGLGLPAKLGWQFAESNILPTVDFGINGAPNNYAEIGPATNAQYKEFAFDPSDVVTMIRGRHILHFGGEFAFYRDDTTKWGNLNGGTLNFSGGYTEAWTVNPTTGIASPNTSTGLEYADFLLGYAANWSADDDPETGVRLKKPQMFIQDDWKLRPNLTVNLGLRYEISHGYTETKGNIASFDPTVINPATNTLGAYWFASTHANGRTSEMANVWDTFLPRTGFAWQPLPNTTLRGGFGIYSYNFSLDNYGNLGNVVGGSIASSGSYNDQSKGIYPTVKFDSNGTFFPLGGGTGSASTLYTAASTSPTRFNGQGGNFAPYHTAIPEIYQWNLGIERQLLPNLAATLTYVGSHGLNLTFPTNINGVPENELSSNDTSGCGTGSTVNCAEPYPIYQGMTGNLYQAISNYNSLQTSITKRLTSGLSFSFNYVWSHMLDDQDSSGWGSHSGTQNYQHLSTLTLNQAAKNYGPSNFDVRNAFKGFVVYQLPFGRGKMLLNQNAVTDAIVGGWQVSGTILELAGNPYNFSAANNTFDGTTAYPNRVAGVSTKPAGGRTLDEWYNPAAFSNPANGEFGDMGRNPLVGPGVDLINLSAGKTFNLHWENMKFGIRADAQNAFNHPSFGSPTGSLTTPDPTTGVFAGPVTGQINSVTQGGRGLQLSARFTF
jgi:hypothetical protein